MELRLLRYFVAVAEELHFGRAAQRLFISQPSLSNQIRKLEQEFDAVLFTRSRRHVALTPAGRALLDPARRVLADAGELPRLVSGAAGVTSGQLVIGYVPYARSPLLSRLLEALRATCPDAHLTVRAGQDSPEVFSDLRDGHVDAGILRAPVSAPWLGRVSLVVEPFCVALPAIHPLASRDRVRLAELEPERFGMFPRELNPPGHDHLMTFFVAAGFVPTIGQASRTMDESLVFVSSGAGVGVFPASVARTLNEPGVVFRPLTDPTPTVEILLAWDVHSPNPLLPALVRAGRTLVRGRTTG